MQLSKIIDQFFSLFSRGKQKKLQQCKESFLDELASLAMDKGLELLLALMSLLLYLNKDYRRHIRNFRGRYSFTSADRLIHVGAVFGPSLIFRIPRLKVKFHTLKNANVTVTFKNGRTLFEFLVNPNPDIFNALIENKLSFSGNFNYLLKFIYMARQLPPLLGITLPQG